MRLLSAEVFMESVGPFATRFVVSAHIVPRLLLREKFDARVHESLENRGVMGEVRNHVARIENHVFVFIRTVFQQFFQDVVAFVNVVEYQKRCFRLPSVVGLEAQRLLVEHVGRYNIAVSYFRSLVAQHFLGVYAVAVSSAWL